jgi:GH18 family chitinase
MNNCKPYSWGIATLLLLFFSFAAQATDKQLIAYYPEWGVHLQPYFVKDIVSSGAAERITVLNYSFAIPAPGPDGDVVCTLEDPEAAYQQWYDGTMAVDEVADTMGDPVRGQFNQLRKLKADYPALKIVVALGGWTGSVWFSDAAADAISRQAFVASCIDLFLDGNLPLVNGAGGAGSATGIFDGFDIDWEYPITGGDTGTHHSSNDDVNLTALLAEFRSQLLAWEANHGVEGLLLTMAVPASDFRGDNYQINLDQQHLDWFNLMTYDFHGGWEKKTGHLTNTMTSADDPSSDAFKLSLDNTVRLYRDVYEVPVNKLVGGATFYGRGWKNVSSSNNGLYQNGQTAPGIYEDGFDYWKDLALLENQGYTFFWDDKALATWLYSPSNSIFWSLDDPQSLALKKRYSDAYGLAGMMLWEVTGDDSGGSLISALHSGDPGTYLAGTSIGGPAVSITQPADCAISLEGFNQVINATAGGSAVQVEFFPVGLDSLGFDNRSPWSWAWFNLPAGEHELVAVATDSDGNFAMSDPVRLTVYGENSGLTLWRTGDSFAIGDEVFYEGCIYAAKRIHVGSRVRTPANSRYWQLVTCEDCGGGGGSGNAPTVSLKTSPADGDSFEAPASILIEATAEDADGDLDRVDFYSGTTPLSTDTVAPYKYTWNNVPAGSYSIRAVAVDDEGNSAEDTATVTVFTLGGCTLAEWQEDTVYHKNDLVQHNTIKWKSKRTSQGVEPGTSPSKWTNLGTCNE